MVLCTGQLDGGVAIPCFLRLDSITSSHASDSVITSFLPPTRRGSIITRLLDPASLPTELRNDGAAWQLHVLPQ
ncbi:hypothetical protein LMH87_007139 [Akanthomyces muscarius]|uniref:Uncharacterized protein n=1 Tax=Akanthomyces muscarius TaxID=2231603 RepID=A0A9W8QPM9_AKAMU|nr:hypothetical protein LMH87_007139 [Akanthomyces muscarius]KAJ4165509.1 hypothetical protein LMH87_007139 [Akanthomyces muscarius]